MNYCKAYREVVVIEKMAIAQIVIKNEQKAIENLLLIQQKFLFLEEKFLKVNFIK
jgi:DNA topoisomerase VI subunit A